jgi:hypothetical protein
MHPNQEPYLVGTWTGRRGCGGVIASGLDFFGETMKNWA